MALASGSSTQVLMVATDGVKVEGMGNKQMHEFEVLATFFVIAAGYIGLFYAAEKFFMK